MIREVKPTKDALKTWVTNIVRHSSHFHYFLHNLGYGSRDTEFPHDMVGPGNKLTWENASRFALQYLDPKPDFMTYIFPAVEDHRQQHHHRMWNNPDPAFKTRPVPGATEQDMLGGALDANISLLENRAYQGGNHSYEQVLAVVDTNPAHKQHWMRRVVSDMRVLEQPRLEAITLEHIPNIGFEPEIHSHMITRVKEVVREFQGKGYQII
ncbi:MAG: hypothetical protein KKG59_00620 [Nanoarchaeota archaeon]|nr:hypothetical protein [Nanoarchaeota archaeon]